MRWAERSLVRRVALTAAAAAIVASVATLMVAVLASDRAMIRKAERDARDGARAMLEELPTGADTATLASTLAEEQSELVPHGYSVAAYVGGGRVAGNDELPRRLDAADGCRFSTQGGDAWLLCAVTSSSTGLTVVAGTPRSQVLSHRPPLLYGGLIALLFVTLAALLGGVLVARFSLRPFMQLHEALQDFDDPTSPSRRSRTLPRSELVELDTIVVTLQQLLERLDTEILRARRFAADAAHELRTPLTKIRTRLELIGEELDPGTHAATQTSRVVQRVAEMSQLVDRLLLLASPPSALRAEGLVSLAAIVEAEALGCSSPGSVQVTVGDDGLVRGDATLLSAVASNAIENALKFSAGEVRAQVSRAGDEVILRVDDRGPGVSDETRARAFDGFYRAPEHRSQPGHGIGLALIAHIVAAHDGACAFVGEAPGAHLEVRLPAHPSQQSTSTARV